MLLAKERDGLDSLKTLIGHQELDGSLASAISLNSNQSFGGKTENGRRYYVMMTAWQQSGKPSLLLIAVMSSKILIVTAPFKPKRKKNQGNKTFYR